MNIIYFVDEFPPFFRGGLGTYAMEMSKKFVELGHSITVFSRNLGNNPTREIWEGVEVHRPLLADISEMLPIFIPEDVKRWHPQAQIFFGETLVYNILSSLKLVNQLVKAEGKEVDVIVSHDWLSAWAGCVSECSLKKPFVFHFHSHEQGRTGNGSLTVKAIENKAGKMADLIVTVSYAMRDVLISLGQDEKKIRVVHNGVDAEKYSSRGFSRGEIESFRNKLGINEKEQLILFVGRLTWVKGVDTLIQAMPLILKEVPNAKLLILGKGEQEELIRHIVTNLGIEKNVILEFKYADEEERILHYAACDAAVFPSKYEPFGIVCTEAMSMGKPAVVGARGVSGLREQVIPSGVARCGFHVNPYDPSDIAKFVVELLKNPDLKEEMGKNARKRVLENFTWNKTAEETLRVYEEAIAKGAK
jgi:glycosyltransferase involved in cell wall biosynthesis